MPAEFYTALASHGSIGIVACVAIYAAWSKDRDLKSCQEARLADSKESTTKLLEVAGQVYAATKQLADVADRLFETKRGGTP